MAEEIRSVTVEITVETNKQTIRHRIQADTLPEAAAEFDGFVAAASD